MIYQTIPIILLIGVLGCGQASEPTQAGAYDLAKPSQTTWLNEPLKEISGLAWAGNNLAAVQDEKGRVYSINPSELAPRKELLRFGKDGDYEGIALASGTYYILKSDGDIFKRDPAGNTIKYPWKGEDGFDFEGLCYQPSENRLLIACKEHVKKGEDDQVWIYAFDLNTLRHIEAPAYTLDMSQFDGKFRPSGIAIAPDQSIYVLSAKTHRLLILSPSGEVSGVYKLPKSMFPQAEGIAFDPSGRLYISNEGWGDLPANVLTFKPRP